ncbi:hypothetical protein [Lihuaxuella thermophila]|uniref:Uncharacterized protein n=1 Tax=Lihuaxuella thermophila TaxID=1173111 RepID=A0A1H8EPA2_9BACL|nr:hypothetical protein [Lihuaxuella thermophila]SEN21349.1 hypothetical protein SAMN05444955_107100 [Lihuaxuella thermophila]
MALMVGCDLRSSSQECGFSSRHVTFIRGPRDLSPWREAGRRELLTRKERIEKRNWKRSDPATPQKEWSKK